jgi:cytochrome P450
MSWNSARFAFHTLPFLNSMAHDQREVLTLTESPTRLLVSAPHILGQLFRADRDMVVEGSSTLRPLLGDHSLLFANGPRHKAYRTAVGPVLLGRRLRGYHRLIAETTHAAIDELSPGAVVNVNEWCRRLVLRIMSKIMFGSVDDHFLGQFAQLMDHVFGSRARTLLYRYVRVNDWMPSPWHAFLQLRAVVDRELWEEVVATARQAGDPTTLITLLTAGADPLGILTDEELRDQVISLLFAGHETTATAVAWTLYWLDRNDDIRHDVAAELADTNSDGQDSANIPLLDAVCRESLRISPPATLAGNRVLTADTEMCGRQLSAGSRLTPCIYVTHHRADLYPDPFRFDPDRFYRKSRSAQEYLPFGGGTRRCLGADLATLELRMITAAVLRRLDLRSAVPGQQATPHVRGPAMGPRRDLRMVVHTRR